MGPDKVRRSGTIAPGIHLSTNKRTCGLCAVFHDERVAMRSLQKSSPNSCCRDGFHTLVTGLDEPEPSWLTKLDALGRFAGGRSKFSKGADNKSGLGAGDGVAEVLQPAVG
jgi:hypothetical protein